MFSQGGWIGGTDHLTANGIWMDTQKGGETEPPLPGTAQLVVFDSQGNQVGFTPLLTGQGEGGRIALFVNDTEQSYTPLIG
jgi:hypothetical protein